MDWIRVEDRLPDKDGLYTVMTRYTDDTCVREFNFNMKCFSNYDGYKVTFWKENQHTQQEINAWDLPHDN